VNGWKFILLTAGLVSSIALVSGLLAQKITSANQATNCATWAITMDAYKECAASNLCVLTGADFVDLAKVYNKLKAQCPTP
jgi:roadblock/LC7 domain-containing protein